MGGTAGTIGRFSESVRYGLYAGNSLSELLGQIGHCAFTVASKRKNVSEKVTRTWKTPALVLNSDITDVEKFSTTK